MTRVKETKEQSTTSSALHLIKKDQSLKKKTSIASRIPVYKALRELLMRRAGMKQLINESE